MSLLKSLFGEKEEAKVEINNKDLFETSVAVPEPIVLDRQPKPLVPEETADDETPAVTYGPAELPSKPGVSEEENKRTIYVGNLPASFITKKRRLNALFRDCGKISSTRFRSVATGGIKLPADQKGNQNLVKKVAVNTNTLDTTMKKTVSAYVVFADEASVELALEKNNMEVKDEGTKEVRHIRVDRVDPTYDSARTVFVGNLPYAADEESLASYFRGLQRLPVQSVRIVRDKETHMCKGFGYVMFDDKASVAKALNHNDEKDNYMGRHLRVQVCGKRYKTQNNVDPRPDKRKERAKTAVGAVRRIIAQQDTGGKKKRRARSDKSKAGPHKAGVSKRAASEAKVNQRVKKLEKRIAKGMGKERK